MNETPLPTEQARRRSARGWTNVGHACRALGPALLFLLFIGLIIFLADTSRLGAVHRIYDFPYGDKVGHILLYGTLCLLIDRSALELLPKAKLQIVVLAVGTVLALAIGLEETSQTQFSSRTADWFDLAASYTGLVLSSVLVIAWQSGARAAPTTPSADAR